MTARRRIRRVGAALLLVGMAAGTGGCGGAKATPATSGTDAGAAGLQRAARAYVSAFLHGDAATVGSFRSRTCAAQGLPQLRDADLAGIRKGIERLAGKPADTLRITGVDLRNLTPTAGEAFVHVDLPAAVEGNDNWLSYTYEAGRWKVTACTQAPLGGHSSSTSAGTSG